MHGLLSIWRTHACGIDVDGNGRCWGDGFFTGDIGDAPAGAFAWIETYNQVSAFYDANGQPSFVYGVVDDGIELWASQVPADPVAKAGFGEWDGCGVTTSGEAYCWGGDPAEEPWLDVPRLNP
jgi:hypothetical protein